MLLTDTRVRNAKPQAKPYKLSDGGGMYLLVKPDGGRYWRLDYRFAGKRRTLALGLYPTVTLSNARTQRDEARRLLAQGSDPNAAKKARKRAAKLARENTFESIAREWIVNHRHRLAHGPQPPECACSCSLHLPLNNDWKCERKCGALARLRFDPDFASVHLNDAL
jgi:hypothetical protein